MMMRTTSGTATTTAAILVSALTALLLMVGVPTTTATEIGLDICHCQPDTITFQLKFNLICDDETVEGPGIIDSACQTDTRNENVQDKLPTVISEIQVYELGGEQTEVLNQVILAGPFADGDNVTYTSIVKSAPENITSADQLPLGFQVVMSGVNVLEQTIIQTWIIQYAGNCGSTYLMNNEQ
jgi:hypothetical protein